MLCCDSHEEKMGRPPLLTNQELAVLQARVRRRFPDPASIHPDRLVKAVRQGFWLLVFDRCLPVRAKWFENLEFGSHPRREWIDKHIFNGHCDNTTKARERRRQRKNCKTLSDAITDEENKSLDAQSDDEFEFLAHMYRWVQEPPSAEEAATYHQSCQAPIEWPAPERCMAARKGTPGRYERLYNRMLTRSRGFGMR